MVVLDGGDPAGSDHLMTEGGVEGVTLIDLSNPPRLLDQSSIVLDIGPGGRLGSRTLDGEHELGRADGVELGAAEALARQLAPLRLSPAGRGEAPLTADLGLAELLDLGDPFEFDPLLAWGPRPNRDRLRVPIGVGPDGTPVELDLKESAQDGMGPHGLLIGATGSGKRAAAHAGAGPGRHALARRRSTSCWSTSRAAPRSPRWTGCRTPAR